MAQQSVKIEAMNPVNKSNIDVIISRILKIEGVSSAHLVDDDQYRFSFTYSYEPSADQVKIKKQVKSLLDLYYSAILSMKYSDKEQSDN